MTTNANAGHSAPLASRRNLLAAVGGCFVLGRFGVAHAADVPSAQTRAEAAARGRRFLEGLFDRDLDLLPEYRGANVYWLFHDNYLAAKVLAGSNPGLAGRIKTAMRRFGVEDSGKIEILFGEAKQPLPFRHYELTEVKRVGEKVVKTEVIKDAVLQGWEEYADLLFLAAIAEADHDKARRHFDAGMNLWDGSGFRDAAAAKHRLYSTYKLALSLLAAAKLGMKPAALPAIVRRLLGQQSDDGGWITDYDEHRKPVGVANVETTCLAILGLDA